MIIPISNDPVAITVDLQPRALPYTVEPGEIWCGYLVWKDRNAKFPRALHLHNINLPHHNELAFKTGSPIRFHDERVHFQTKRFYAVYAVEGIYGATFYMTNRYHAKRLGTVEEALLLLSDTADRSEEDTRTTAHGCACRFVGLITPSPQELIEVLSAESEEP